MEELGAHDDARPRPSSSPPGASKHKAAGELTVAVNLSTHEIDRPDLVADVAAIRRETGLPPGALKLEVTEGDVMRDPERAAVILASCARPARRLALDDFGTGFSSLTYLTRLPFDTLKIDRYFVRTMATNEGSLKIVSSVVKLGQDLNLESSPRASRTPAWPASCCRSAATTARASATRPRFGPGGRGLPQRKLRRRRRPGESQGLAGAKPGCRGRGLL